MLAGDKLTADDRFPFRLSSLPSLPHTGSAQEGTLITAFIEDNTRRLISQTNQPLVVAGR